MIFQLKQCHNCHSLGDEGGKRGPALDAVAVRLTQDQLIRQVIQGGGNMPAYGKNLISCGDNGSRRLSRDAPSRRTIAGTGRLARRRARRGCSSVHSRVTHRIAMTSDTQALLQTWSAPSGWMSRCCLAVSDLYERLVSLACWFSQS